AEAGSGRHKLAGDAPKEGGAGRHVRKSAWSEGLERQDTCSASLNARPSLLHVIRKVPHIPLPVGPLAQVFDPPLGSARDPRGVPVDEERVVAALMRFLTEAGPNGRPESGLGTSGDEEKAIGHEDSLARAHYGREPRRPLLIAAQKMEQWVCL